MIDTIDGLHKTGATPEDRHMETAEKMKELTVLVSDNQVQVKEQEQKMVEESSNDFRELDNGNKALPEKWLEPEKSIDDRVEDLGKTDDSILSARNQ